MRLSSITLVLLAGCAASTLEEQPGPRGLRANDHMAMANREDNRASEIQHWPDLRPGPDGMPVVSGVWHGSWDTASEHRRAAQAHRGAAAELEAAYEEACGTASYAEVSVSPLQRFGVGGSAIADGTLVLLSPDAGPPDKLLAAMRCHRAWMMLGRTAMDDCPLDLPGLHVSATGDQNGIELAITIDDPSLVAELRRRAAHDLEAAQHGTH
jgi:hypothetical protein